MTAPPPLRLDQNGAASLDGTWEFWPGDAMEGEPEAIVVPGLWEAHGWLDLDGAAWYRKRFSLEDASGFWTLRFGAVMDVTEVWLNGVLLGRHDNAFTPFGVDATSALRVGENDLTVRVFDPDLCHPEHVRLAHGKQGWGNSVFPSPPSLYMTYGGIWQSVTLCRHGQLTVDDVFVNGDPDDLHVTVSVKNHADAPAEGTLGVRAVGRAWDAPVKVAAAATCQVVARFGATVARRWTPDDPALHTALADVVVNGEVSHQRAQRFGLRTVRVDGVRLLLNGEPYRMKSALVQGFRAEELYAEGDRAAVEEEVRAAQAMGFNTLRLHIKAFAPLYLDVCDELGMLLHCDIPIAEPIDYESFGGEGETALATRAVEAVRQQIARDRNHPSVIMWTLMNEVCLGRIEARSSAAYQRFARALVAAAKETDPTRPVVENDWVEPDPDRVVAGDVLTAHWYGRLHAEYLDTIERACERWADVDRPLFVTEFGDWGLPDMPSLAEPPFWDTRAMYAAGLAATRWPASMGRFIAETQRYQGISDRLQAEVFRRHDHLGGYCVTELTDVPHEFNGLLDLRRRAKPIAAAEMARANQTVLPMLSLESLVVVAGEFVTAPLHVANDGPGLDGVDVEVRFGDSSAPLGMDELLLFDASRMAADAIAGRFDESGTAIRVEHLHAHRSQQVGVVSVAAPRVPGSHDLVLRLRTASGVVAENRYTVHVVAPPVARLPVRVIGDDPFIDDALASVSASASASASASDEGPTIVAEGSLDEQSARVVRERLDAGEVVVVLAQPAEAAEHYPIPVTVVAVGTEWGSSVFHFTTDHGALPSLPRRNILVAEDSTVQARSAVTSVDREPFPDTPVVIAFKPVPQAMTGTVVGSHQVGPGRLVFCQYRLCERAAKGDAAARAVLADLVRWAGEEQPRLVVDEGTLADGRRVARYSHDRGVAR